jgi:uncharacterized protein YggE
MAGGILKVGALVLALAALAACGEPTLLTVHASSTTRAAPDLAIVTLGVSARGGTAQAAQVAQNTRMSAVLAAARAAGVEEADVQTVGFSIEPIYVYPRNAPARITGYESRNTVSIRVRDLSRVSGLIDATVAEGANQLQGIEFTFQNEEGSRDAARAEALATARTRAQAYAEAAGMRVVRVLEITEPGAVGIRPGAARRVRGAFNAQDGALAESSAIMPGQLDAESAVTGVFELR